MAVVVFSLRDKTLHKRQRCGHSRRGNKLQCPIHLRRRIQPAATQDRRRLFQNANLLNESAMVLSFPHTIEIIPITLEYSTSACERGKMAAIMF